MWRAALALLTLTVATVASAQDLDAQPIDEQTKQAVLERLERVLTQQAFVPGADFSKWPEMVKGQAEAIEKAKTRAEFALAVNRVMGSYGFSHITLFPPGFGQMRQTQRRAGIGIRIQIEPEGIRVTDVFPDSPANDAGIQAGDLVVEHDGKPVRTVADLQGVDGQKSTVVVLRGDQRLSFEVTRREHSTVIPETYHMQGQTAVVRIPTFDIGYSTENVDRIMAEVASKATSVVLDLRGNGGGRVVNLQHLASFFLDAQTQPMGTFIGRAQVAAFERQHGETSDLKKIAEATPSKVRATRNRGNIRLNMPVAVLIDGGSGSASEILAAALREQRKSPVIGSKSAGAVLASVVVPLGNAPMGSPDNFWVQFPLTDYLTIGGQRLEGNGVKPDVEAKVRRFGEPDDAVAKALEALASAALAGAGNRN